MVAMVLCCLQMPAPVHAAQCANDGGFLGFKAWYTGLCRSGIDGQRTNEIINPKELNSSNQERGFATFIWTIVLNVIFDISLAVGYLTLAMIIYGGYLYIMSQGDPGKIASSKKTLTRAVIGTVIAMGATVIVNTISFVLLGVGTNDVGGINDVNTSVTAGTIISNVLSWAYSAAGIVAVVFIIKGGFDYMMSRGDPSKTHQGTQTLIFAVVGLVVVILAAVITNFILGSAGGAL